MAYMGVVDKYKGRVADDNTGPAYTYSTALG
jgi:hypothetical protein